LAKKKKIVKEDEFDMGDFTSNLIRDLNKENGDKVAYNLSTDVSPTHIKRWIPTGIKQLDYVCSNRRNGGLPEGRIVEIFGAPSIGKSHVAAQICKSVQKMKGIAVYIDSETATSVENLQNLGVNVRKGFVYVNEHCTENILAIAESTILKARALTTDIPVVIVWDSVAASSPKAELEGDYEQQSIGLQARAISKGMRKITGVIADQNVLFVILNQVRVNIGVRYGDPDTTPGGKAIPFHASTRIKLSSGTAIKNDEGEVIGINVISKTIKNKVAAPFRTVRFQIHFGKGIREHEETYDLLRKNGPELINGKIYQLTGGGSWKSFYVWDASDEKNREATDEAMKIMSSKKKESTPKQEPVVCIINKKFYKSGFDKIINDAETKVYVEDLMERTFVRIYEADPDIDLDSYVEVAAIASELSEGLIDIEEYLK
jgi:recombination protein RecA|tara:strand:+ start:513 stop:1805 length:1293 start_codon:yes stop_codon:yes gene_type:complete